MYQSICNQFTSSIIEYQSIIDQFICNLIPYQLKVDFQLPVIAYQQGQAQPPKKGGREPKTAKMFHNITKLMRAWREIFEKRQ